MSNPCRHAQNAAAFIVGRAVVGRLKYGHTLADADLSSAELVQHAREEAADLLIYLTALKETIAKSEPARPAVTREAVTAIVTASAKACQRVGGTCQDDPACYCRRTIDAIMTLIEGSEA